MAGEEELEISLALLLLAATLQLTIICHQLSFLFCKGFCTAGWDPLLPALLSSGFCEGSCTH